MWPLMLVAMMDVGKVRVSVRERFVRMAMRMRFVSVPREAMSVSMMRVVYVRVLMDESGMLVPVLVPLGQMQPDTDRHEHAGDQHWHGHRVAA